MPLVRARGLSTKSPGWIQHKSLAVNNRAFAQLVIPFSALGVEVPAKGITWKANSGRNHALPRETIDRAIWSSSQTSANMDDTALMGQIVSE
jgi:hypothetical protein